MNYISVIKAISIFFLYFFVFLLCLLFVLVTVGFTIYTECNVAPVFIEFDKLTMFCFIYAIVDVSFIVMICGAVAEVIIWAKRAKVIIERYIDKVAAP